MNEIDIYSQPSYSDKIKLYHWSFSNKSNTIIPFRFRTKPSDTPILIHNIVNKYANDKFNIPIRNLFFTYTDKKHKDAKRVIPLGDNVKYFYHPDVEDMTSLLYLDKFKILEKYLKDNVNEDVGDELISMIEHAHSIKELFNEIQRDYDENTVSYIKNTLAMLVGYIKDYVNNVVMVEDIEQIPSNTEAEVMVYAPVDIYLME